MTDLSKIACPTCQKPHTWQPDNPFKPFCSDRCKLIDLGEWAAERNTIEGQIQDNLNESPKDDEENE